MEESRFAGSKGAHPKRGSRDAEETREGIRGKTPSFKEGGNFQEEEGKTLSLNILFETFVREGSANLARWRRGNRGRKGHEKALWERGKNGRRLLDDALKGTTLNQV